MREIEDLSELGSNPQAIAERWLEEQAKGDKFWDKWRRRVKKIIDIYADQGDKANFANSAKKINILWSNIETIKPALYAKTPIPQVQRRNKDKDPVGREASEVLKRCLSYCNDAYDFDGVMRDDVHDYAISSMGVARVIYDPLIEGDGESERIVGEYSKIDYVHWSDFTTNEARKWSEVRWESFRHFFTRDELRSLSPKYADSVTLDYSPDDDKDGEKGDLFKKATVYEIWDKQSGLIYWIAKSFKDAPLKVAEPFCSFKDFFPCPRPLMGTQGSSIVPTPDYVLYQDQAEIINELTNKIYTLTKALKAAGVYNGKVGQLENLLGEGYENTLIPVSDWASFAQGGGMDGAIQFLPVKEIAAALISAWEAREKAKADLYEATGLSDIVRGASDPNETATAQAIKNQWGSLRIRDRQKEVQRFARDLMRLKAEVIAERFSLETIQSMSGLKLLTQDQKKLALSQPLPQDLPPEKVQEAQELLEKPTWEEVYALLKNDKLRGFSIDIETDSTIEPDEQADKQSRIEFLTAVSGFLQQMGNIVVAAPETAPLMGELLTFGVRGFDVGTQLEGTIENTMEALENKILTPQPPQPDPDNQAKLQVEMQKHKDQMTLEAKKHQDQIQLEYEKLRGDHAINAQKLEHEKLVKSADIQMQAVKMKNDVEMSQSEKLPNDPRSMAEHMFKLYKQDEESAVKEQEKEAAQQQEIDAMKKALVSIGENLQQNSQIVTQLLEAINRPRTVVRGTDGRISGVH